MYYVPYSIVNKGIKLITEVYKIKFYLCRQQFSRKKLNSKLHSDGHHWVANITNNMKINPRKHYVNKSKVHAVSNPASPAPHPPPPTLFKPHTI